MKIKLLIILMFGVCGLYASEIPDISRYKDLTASKNSESLMFENFDGKLSGWTLGRGCKLVKNSGMTGTNALLCERIKPSDYNSAVARYKLKLNQGKVYTVSIMYRTEGVPGKKSINSPAIEFRNNGKYQKMVNPNPKPIASKDWKKVKVQFKAGKDNYLLLRLFYNLTGKIWWDNLKIEEVSSNQGIVYPVRPHGLILDDNGNIAFKAYVWEIAPEKLRDHAVLVELGGRKKLLDIDKRGNAVGRLGTLKKGTYRGRASLLNLKSQKIVAKDDFTLYRRPAAVLPEAVASIDKYGRALVNGKPFMPLGIYVTWIRTEEDVKRIADGGFNFILTYTARAMNIQKEKNKISQLSYPGPPPHFKSKKWKKEIRNSLDMLQKYNLKLMGFPNMNEYRHPALLAAYIADEAPVTQIPKFCNLRTEYAEKFPFSPVVGLTDKTEDYIPLSKALDVLGIDIYPVYYKDSPQSMSKVRFGLNEAAKTGIPIMFVPQTFNWGAHRSDSAYSKFKYPTEEEMRSMVLLPAIYGIKWFCFYSYTTIMERQEKKDPGSSKIFWPRVVAVAKVLRELEPWLLSLDHAPVVKVKTSGEKSLVDARAFIVNNKIRVLITATGPGKVNAEIIVSGYANLKSKYGRTRNSGGNKYVFSGDGISSDILEN